MEPTDTTNQKQGDARKESMLPQDTISRVTMALAFAVLLVLVFVWWTRPIIPENIKETPLTNEEKTQLLSASDSSVANEPELSTEEKIQVLGSGEVLGSEKRLTDEEKNALLNNFTYTAP